MTDRNTKRTWGKTGALLAFLTMILLGNAAQAQGKKAEPAKPEVIDLQTVFMRTAIEGAYQISLAGELHGASGLGKLVLDPNLCGLNEFGDTTFCTRMAPTVLDVRIEQIRRADPHGWGRRLFRLNHDRLGSKLFLILPGGDDTSPRLVSSSGRNENRVVTLEPRAERVVLEASGNTTANAKRTARHPDFELGVARYHAHQLPGGIFITAEGTTPTTGYEVKLALMPIDINPPEFALVWKKPEIGGQAVTPFHVHAFFGAGEIDEVFVHDKNGRHTVKVERVADFDGAIDKGGAGIGDIGAAASGAGSFEGVSEKGNFQAALDLAVGSAYKQLTEGIVDGLIEWETTKVHGQRGGIAGLERITVEIKASGP